MAKLLIVDDEKKIVEALREYAQFEGFEAETAEDGFDALQKAKNNAYDFIIMDIMMPKLDGFSAVKKIREFSNVPVLMLSARGEEYDKLHGFDLGIDDYVVKPFSPRELMARVRAILKRGESKRDTKLVFEGLVIDEAARNVFADGQKLNLTPKEYELLFYLLRNRGIAVSREQILTEVWGYDYFGDDRTIDSHIRMLRGNLGVYEKFIVTLRGHGYKFEAEV